MKNKHFLSWCLCLTIIFSMVLWAAPTVSADYAGVDYSRFDYGKDGRVYPASLTIGDMKFSGTLRCTHNYDLSDINEAIAELFKRTGLSEKDIVNANEKIKAAEKDRTFTYEDGIRIAQNLAQILGGDTGRGVVQLLAEDAVKVLLSEDKGQSIAELAIDAIIMEVGMVDGKIQDGVLDSAAWKIFNESYDDLIKPYVISWGNININPMTLLIETIKVSYAEYKLDVERWQRRVDAVNAKDFLNDFYKAVDLILEERGGSTGTWQLKIVSTKDRYFSFWGSENNLQRWSVVVDMYGENTSTRSPLGLFEGTVAVYANHNMSPFDAKLWNSKFGNFKEGWLNDVLSAPYKVRMGGYTVINRSIIMEDASFRITGSDLLRTFSSTAKGLPMRIKFSSYDYDVDEVYVSSTRHISVESSIGFTQDGVDGLTGYVDVDMALHAEGMEGGGDGIRIVRDRAAGDVGIVFFGESKTDIGPGEEAVIWDANIWKPLEGGIALHIGG